MAIEVPSLSDAGWVSGPAEKLDKLMSYYFVSEHSQSILYEGKIKSLPKHIQSFGNDPLTLQQVLRSATTDLLEPYFDSVSVTVNTDSASGADPGRINVIVDIVVTQDGVTYSAGRELQTINGTLLRILDINNNIGNA